VPADALTVRLRIDRDGAHVEVANGEGRVLHREGVGSPTTTIEKGGRMTCTALLTPEGSETLARVLLLAAGRARPTP